MCSLYLFCSNRCHSEGKTWQEAGQVCYGGDSGRRGDTKRSQEEFAVLVCVEIGWKGMGRRDCLDEVAVESFERLEGNGWLSDSGMETNT